MAQRQEGSAEEGEEHRLRAALRHLQAEAGVLERLVYKHRNQHRGAAYFQYLLKVRRDLKLLLSANLAEVINAVFPVITCRKPANTILVPNRQGKRKPGANHSHYKRLLGVARLLSQMLLDVVSIYNKVTDLTDKKQAVKISIDKVQAFREYYPSSNDPSTILECVWVKDKFVLHEKTKASSQKTQDEDLKSCTPDSSIQYETLGLVSEETENLDGANTPAKQQHASLADQPDKATHCGDAGDSQSGRQLPNDENTLRSLLGTPAAAPAPRRDVVKPDTRKRVAFIAVGKTKVTVTPPETSSVVTKKQRVDTIRQTTTDPAL
uniref:Nucleolus and neural progenitor protein-like N-terminal domain-containing protein n=1 Tax=Aegilops tauschii TaxID=37682 RepID=N1QV23_AEGTA